MGIGQVVRSAPLASINYLKQSTQVYFVPASGDWPSGKAAGSGPVIGGSNPSSPAKENTPVMGVFSCL